MKRFRKQMQGIAGASMLGAGASIGLGAIGGTTAAHGAAGIQNMMAFAPAIGTMAGVGAVIRSIPEMPRRRKRMRLG